MFKKPLGGHPNPPRTGRVNIIFGDELLFISLPISYYPMIRCLLQFANSKCRVNGTFCKSIIRVHWISRQPYSVGKKTLIQD